MTWPAVMAAADAGLCVTFVEELVRLRAGEDVAPDWPTREASRASAELRAELARRWKPVTAAARTLPPTDRRRVMQLAAAALASVPPNPTDLEVRMMEREGMALWLPSRGELRAQQEAA